MTAQTQKPALRIMRLPAVKTATGLSRSTIYELMKAERFPKGHRIGGSNITGWNSLEIEAWIAKQLGEVA